MSIQRMMFAALALAVPSVLSAQASEQPPPEVQEWIAEVREIQTRLAPVEQEALQDSAIQQTRQEVADAVREAMIAEDATMGEKLDRMTEINAEAQAAQAAGNQEKIAELTQEAQVLQPAILEAQQAALAKPEVEAKVEAFREDLHETMIEIDPEAEPLLERMIALSKQIEDAMRTG